MATKKVSNSASTDTKNEVEEVKLSPAPKKSSKAASSMEELLKSTGYQLKGLKKGDTVNATITRISAREIALDTGSKTEGVVMDKEIENYRDMLSKLKVGDIVAAQVIVAENDRGQSVLSIRNLYLKTVDDAWLTCKRMAKLWM